MKTLQKGSAAITAVLILILIVLLAVGGYLYVRRNQTPVETNPVPVSQNVTQNTTPDTSTPVTPPADTTPTVPHATPDPITKVYTDKTFGYTATYSRSYTASTDKAGKVTMTAGPGIDPIVIVRANNSADTSTGKWGKNVLSYGTNGWVTQLQSATDGSVYTAPTVPYAFTASGLPIFNGGTRHGFGASVYVVALSHTKFLIISGGEGLTTATGYDASTDPTLKVAKTVTLLK